MLTITYQVKGYRSIYQTSHFESVSAFFAALSNNTSVFKVFANVYATPEHFESLSAVAIINGKAEPIFEHTLAQTEFSPCFNCCKWTCRYCPHQIS